jgi:hypothetical protein
MEAQSVTDGAVTSASIEDASIELIDIGSNGAQPGQIMKWSGNGWELAEDDGGDCSVCGWMDGGYNVYLTDISDWVGIGTYNPQQPLHVFGSPTDIHPAFFEGSNTYGTAIKIRSVDVATNWELGVSGSDMAYNYTVPPGDFYFAEEGTAWPALILSSEGTIMMNVNRELNDANEHIGVRSYITNSLGGKITGLKGYVESTTFGAGGDATGVSGTAISDGVQRIGGWFTGDGLNESTTEGESFGVVANAHFGDIAYGIYASAFQASTNWAGYFSGDVKVTGYFNNSKSTVVMDHPLDPENRYLRHNSLSSPDMKNVYDGVVTLDANGEGQVTLPDYFEALNNDFRYQLTAIGAPGPNLYISEKIFDNQFKIAGGNPHMEVSWQVTGIRHDKYAAANRIQVEVDKPYAEKGLYLHPEEHGQPIEKYINYKQQKESLEHRAALSSSSN